MKHITIDDIAKEAGVSKSTVSRVLSRPNLVKERTREQILSVIDKYSYVPSALAQGLAGLPMKNIGFAVDEFSNNFYIDLADGIDSVFSASDYALQVMSSRWNPVREIQGVRSMIINRNAGILIAPSSPGCGAVDLLKKSKVPFVLLNCRTDDPDVSYVSCDNYKGGRLMAEHIGTLDFEQLIILPVSDHQTVLDRMAGFEDHIDMKALRPIMSSNAKTYQDGYRIAQFIAETYDLVRKKTCLFVANDYVAIGVITKLLELKIPIPGQAAVAGFDDIRISAMCRIPLTTVSQSVCDMGRIAAQSLLGRIQHHKTEPIKYLVEPRLIIRESTKGRT
ncbi:MAG: LacI family transcriptional regulator [Treponema sp.]|jgi:DNA-binding LacI/PurR family transcriptional regulator|nr:LacI family transcriptional regulator [Treponema sp.]